MIAPARYKGQGEEIDFFRVETEYGIKYLGTGLMPVPNIWANYNEFTLEIICTELSAFLESLAHFV